MARRADMTIGCVEAPLAEATQLGVMEVDERFHVIGFEEKPAEPRSMPGRPGAALGSMGIYVFNADFLYGQLIRDAEDAGSQHDFGHNIIPHLIGNRYRVFAHRLRDSCTQLNEGVPYWRDVLDMSRRVAEAVGLGYIGVDIIIDAEEGPMLLEANARPGLAIQIANARGLLPRLAEIDELKERPPQAEDDEEPWVIKIGERRLRRSA